MSKDPFSQKTWPVNIQLKKKERLLTVDFDDGSTFAYPAEYLRVESPSAEVQGHGASQKKVIPGCRNVGIVSVESVGNYAVRIKFDDHHETGIYSWNYLYELGKNKNENWNRYLKILESVGLSRDP